MSDEQQDDEYEAMAAALAEGGEVGFCRPGGPHDGVEDVSLRQHGDAFIAKRIDGSTLGVFASLDVGAGCDRRRVDRRRGRRAVRRAST